MTNLHHFPARICPVSGGYLVQNQKVLLVKHKKLGFWLAPGGHIEEGELPHEAAEREVYEETNVRVKAISVHQIINSERNQYLPAPVLMSLHWVSKDNYEARQASSDLTIPNATPMWPRGCEQHLGYIYLVQPVGSLEIKHDPDESDGIDWFGLNQLKALETSSDIRQEIQLILKITSTM